MGIRRFLLLPLLLMPATAWACIGGDMMEPASFNGFWGLVGYTIFAVAFTRIQRFTVKRQMIKAGVAVPENLGTVMAASNAIIFSALALIFLFIAGMMKIKWGTIPVYFSQL